MSKEKWPQHLWDEAGMRLRGFSWKRLEERSGVQRIEFNGIGIIQAQSRHTTTLDPLAGFEEIIRHTSRFQQKIPPEADETGSL